MDKLRNIFKTKGLTGYSVVAKFATTGENRKRVRKKECAKFAHTEARGQSY